MPILQLPLDVLDINHSYRLVDQADPDLVAAISRQKRVAVPILARPLGKRYEVVDGRRRVLAAREAGISHIDAVVEVLHDLEARYREVQANVGRKGFTPPELARAALDLIRFELGHAAFGEDNPDDPHQPVASYLWRLRHSASKDPLALEQPLAQSVIAILERLGMKLSSFWSHILPSIDWPQDVQEALAQGMPIRAAAVAASVKDDTVRQHVILEAQAAKERGESTEKAAVRAKSQGLEALAHKRHIDRAQDYIEENQQEVQGWLYPNATGSLAYLPETAGVCLDDLGTPLEPSPVVLAGIIAKHSSPQQRVGVFWAGTGAALDLALMGGRAAWGCDVLGVRAEVVVCPPWQANPGHPLDLAVLLLPPFGSGLTAKYGQQHDADISAATWEDYKTLLTQTCEAVAGMLEDWGRAAILMDVGMAYLPQVLLALGDFSLIQRQVYVSPNGRAAELAVFAKKP